MRQGDPEIPESGRRGRASGDSREAADGNGTDDTRMRCGCDGDDAGDDGAGEIPLETGGRADGPAAVV